MKNIYLFFLSLLSPFNKKAYKEIISEIKLINHDNINIKYNIVNMLKDEELLIKKSLKSKVFRFKSNSLLYYTIEINTKFQFIIILNINKLDNNYYLLTFYKKEKSYNGYYNSRIWIMRNPIIFKNINDLIIYLKEIKIIIQK
jgi:hypothetical protein